MLLEPICDGRQVKPSVFHPEQVQPSDQ